MPTLQVDADVPLYYEVQGQGPALILLNGLSQTTMNWLTQSRRLARKYTVVCFDARGQGQTPTGRHPLTPDVLVNDLERLMDALGLPRAHLCGFSFGARLALAFAARCPTRLDHLVLTSLGAGDEPLRRLIVRAWIEVLERGGLEAMTWCAMPHIFGRSFIARYERQMAQFVRASLHRNTVEGIRALLEVLGRFESVYEEAPRIKAPTLLITATEDPLVDVEGSRRVQALIPGCELSVMAESGHTIPIERPQEWRDQVEAFIDRSSYGSAPPK